MRRHAAARGPRIAIRLQMQGKTAQALPAMNITALYIRGYGIFRDCRVQDLSPGLNVFLGDNEAGKSTCLAFIRDVLFGAPDGRSKEKSYPSLQNGRWGGSLGLNSRDQQSLMLHRDPGTKGGKLSITRPDGQQLGPEVLNMLLGGTTREVFRNIYAFSLSELQTLETLSTERIRDAIYSAGLGAGLSSLPQVLKELESRREKLFKARGQNQSINQLLTRIEAVRRDLRQAQGDIQAFDQVTQELESLEQQREGIKQNISSQQGRLSQLSNLLSRWEEWSEYQSLSKELQELPLVQNFPGDGLHCYEALSRRLQHLQEQREGLEQEVGEVQSRLDGLRPDQKLLDMEQEIQTLAEDKARFVQDQEQLPALEQKLQARQQALQATLRQLGQDWDDCRVQALDTSLRIKEQLESYAKNLRELEEHQKQATRELESREQELSRAATALQQAEKDLKSWGSGDPELNLELAAELGRERDRFAQTLEELQARRQERDQGRRELQRILAEIGPGWRREDLDGLDTSLQVKERLENYARDFAELEQQEQALEQELRARDRGRQELQKRLQGKEQELQALQEPGFTSLQEIRQAREDLQRLQSLQAEAETCTVRIQALQDRIQDLQRQADSVSAPSKPGRLLPAAVASGLLAFLLFCLLAATGIISWSMAWPPAVALGLASSVLCWIWQRERRASTSGRAQAQAQKVELDQEIQELRDNKLHGLEQEKHRLDREVQQLKTSLQSGREFKAAALEAELESSRDILHSRQGLENELQELKQDLEDTEQQLQDLHEQKAQKDQRRQRLQASWRHELDELSLDSGLGPASALRVLERAEAAKSELSHLLQSEVRLEHLQAFVQDYADKAAKVLQAQGLDPEQSKELLSVVDRYLDKTQQEHDRLRNRELTLKERDKKAEEWNSQKQEYDSKVQKLKQADQRLQEKISAWRQWLEDAGLPQDLTPQLAKEALDKAEKTQGILNELGELQEQRQACLCRKQEFIRRTEKLALSLDRKQPVPDRLPSFLQTLLQELESSKEAQARSQELQEQLQARRQTMEDIREKISRNQEEIQRLLQQSGSGSEQEFLRQGEILEKRQHLEARLQELERSLLRGTGQDSIQAVQEQFSGWSRQGLQEEISRLEQEIEEQETNRQELSSRIGKLGQEKQRLSSTEEVARLRQEEECLRQELHQASLRWSTYTLALHLLRQAKAKYEQEQQPQVVRSAGAYLTRITDEAYTHVYAPLGQGEVYAVDSLGQPRHPEELSRGTAEQLYLSLRFGYVQNASKNFEPLPVIMDDILVNFDPSRAQNAALAIVDLAREHQVLYFTCHPHTLQYLNKADPIARTFQLHNGSIQPRT